MNPMPCNLVISLESATGIQQSPKNNKELLLLVLFTTTTPTCNTTTSSTRTFNADSISNQFFSFLSFFSFLPAFFFSSQACERISAHHPNNNLNHLSSLVGALTGRRRALTGRTSMMPAISSFSCDVHRVHRFF